MPAMDHCASEPSALLSNSHDTGVKLYLELMKRCLLNEIYPELEMSVKNYQVSDRQEGREWPAGAHTMIGRKRLDNIQFCIEDILKHEVPGDLMETGVWRGGAIIFMRSVLQAYGISDRIVWGADSFCGLPPPKAEYPADNGSWLHECPELSVPLDDVKANFQKYGLLDEQVRFLPGFFSATLPAAPMQQLSLIRLDGDLYESTLVAMEHLYPKLSIGGYLIVDDYVLPPCRQAITDYRIKCGITEDILPIDWAGVFWQRVS